MFRSFLRTIVLVGCGAFYGALAQAMPTAPVMFCEIYAESPVCLGGIPSCLYCHTAPPEQNAFGAQIAAALAPETERPLPPEVFAEYLPSALMQVEGADADEDGVLNADEILGGTLPGEASSVPRPFDCEKGENPYYRLCEYDASYAFKKLSIDFCGIAPDYAEIVRFANLEPADQRPELHSRLDHCLKSEAWLGKDGSLWRLAHRKIRPLRAIKSGEDEGVIPVSDYYDDYAMFVYISSGDRDVRDLMLADYFVTREGHDYRAQPSKPGQNVGVARRAGMLTTNWNLVMHVMFSAIARTAAAQAYRGYLNLDISKLEGIRPIAGEPKDYDNQGVAAPACARCHSTLDPLTYPFRNYSGLDTRPFGAYIENRIERFHAPPGGSQLSEVPEHGYVLGTPVENLVEWAEVAANSDEFARAVVEDFWRLLIGERPKASDTTFEMLWRDLRGRHGYQVEQMLHALIETEAYGAP